MDAPYFQLVFTVPEELNSIIYSNQKLLYDCLYTAASSTITELSRDSKYLGAETVIKYLGKYTHRIAISNHRMISMTDDSVTFSVKDYRNEGRWKPLTLSGEKFIRRFLMHVPPKRFVHMRHYGLLAIRTKSKQLTLCRNLLGCKKYISDMREMDNIEILKHLWNIDVCSCKSCGGHMLAHQTRHHLRI